jgi:hypothetical protein
MADPIRDHPAAVIARLRSHALLADSVIDGDNRSADPNTPPRPAPYVVVYANTGIDQFDRQSCEIPTRMHFIFQIQCVGEDANQARAFAGLVWGLLAGWRPTVAGWSPQALKRDANTPFFDVHDKDFSPEFIYTTDRYDLITTRAA